MLTLSTLTEQQSSRRLYPRNDQVGRLVSHIASRRFQESVIRHWNRTRRLPEGLFRSPLLMGPPSPRWRVMESA